ncbi:MAG TPA: diguanylate cyclase, partial [Phycisphaerae bacterium]|nr:diguanylate cyclase [Phycisphaerae bacterium]
MSALSFDDFETCGKAVLAFLHKRLGFNLWMITRKEGDDWIVLQREDHGYGVEPGNVFRWADSFCSEMVKGNGPRFAPNSDHISAYANAPIGRHIEIKAYIGMPIVQADGSLFGTLCAIDPSPKPTSIVNEQEIVELLGAMLSTILQAELKSIEEKRRLERLEFEALTDPMTGLYNRRGWNQLVSLEEDRCRRYGHSATVIIVDMDRLKHVNDTEGHAAGDALIMRTCATLHTAVRASDILARLGGDEFGILCTECDRTLGEEVLER